MGDAHTPMPLEVAVKECFPFGGASVSTLRTEARKGRLAIERIGGKDYVTRAAIEQMRKLCRVQARGCASPSTGEKVESQSISSETERIERARNAALKISRALTKSSQPIVNEHFVQTLANVISLKSQSQKS